MFLFMSMDCGLFTKTLKHTVWHMHWNVFCLYIFFSKMALIFLCIWISLHDRHWLFNLLINYDIRQDEMWSFILQRMDNHLLKLSHPLLLLWAYLSIRSDVNTQFFTNKIKGKISFHCLSNKSFKSFFEFYDVKQESSQENIISKLLYLLST